MTLIQHLQQTSDERELRQHLQGLLTSLFTGELSPEAIFSTDYVQLTDGKTLNYSEFLQHLDHVRSQISHIAFSVEQACCNPQLLADRHIVTVTRPDNKKTEIEVYMFAQLREGKICRIDEITRVISGNVQDKSLASATA